MTTPPPMLEAELQAQVIDLCRLYGVKWYHTHDSRRSPSGFPDLVLVHPRTHRLLFVELKRDGERPTPAQREWLEALPLSLVWHPADLRSGVVASAIARLAR